jgi:hypothetical protein
LLEVVAAVPDLTAQTEQVVRADLEADRNRLRLVYLLLLLLEPAAAAQITPPQMDLIRYFLRLHPLAEAPELVEAIHSLLARMVDQVAAPIMT